MRTSRIRDVLIAAAVLAAGVVVGGSVMVFETEEAVAATTRTYAVKLPAGVSTGECTSYTDQAYKGTVSTRDSGESDYVTFGDCDGGEACTNSCGNLVVHDGTQGGGLAFDPHGGVEISSGSTRNGTFGWLNTLPGHGDRATSMSNGPSCYVRMLNWGEGNNTDGPWTVNSGGSCSNCFAFCTAIGDFS